MKKVSKSRKGFTMAEMVLVIAIIVILAAVLVTGYVKILNFITDETYEVEQKPSKP
ncbi:MAG: type II secretion system protein [Clostridiales bacterium]|nr:type II secretion system protein [Clostridiales bacterium]